MDNEPLIYPSSDGSIKIDIRMEKGSVWLTQHQMGTPIGKAKSTISEHLKNTFTEGELIADSGIRKFRTTAASCRNRKHRSKDAHTLSFSYSNLKCLLSENVLLSAEAK